MKTSGNDLLDQDVYGTQEQAKQYSIFHTLYKELYDIDFKDTFFALNLCETSSKKILSHDYKKIAISYHTEHIHYQSLYDIFINNKDRHFLLLSDFSSFSITDNLVVSDFWPDNVTPIQWLSWGEQIKTAKDISGIAGEPRKPTKKISSLSNRHEYHKATITAFILNEFNKDETLVSWHGWQAGEKVYYLEENYEIDDRIKKYIFDSKFKNIEKLTIDEYDNSVNSPDLNIYWNHPAFLDCVTNVTNESTFQSIGNLNNGESVAIPGPFITEKTIKPLLSGTAFVHVGQPFLLDKFNELGFCTDFGFPSEYDKEPYEDERILKLYDTLEFIRNTPTKKIHEDSYDAINHNLQHIKSGKFLENCKKHNIKNLNIIIDWNSNNS